MSYNLINTIKKLKGCADIPRDVYSTYLAIASCVYQDKNGHYDLECFTSVDYLASLIHCCTRTIKRHLAKLQGWGLIRLKRKPQSNEYSYMLNLLAVDNLKETLRKEKEKKCGKIVGAMILDDKVSPRNSDKVSPRVQPANNNINNNINNNLLTTELTTEIASDKKIEENKDDSIRNEKPFKVAVSMSNMYRKVPCGTSLHKLDGRENMDEKNMRVLALRIFQKLKESREKHNKGDLGNQQLDIGIIMARIEKLVRSGYTLDKAVLVCEEVLKYWDHRLTHVLTGEYQAKAQKSYCAKKVFFDESNFDQAVKSLINGKFVDEKLEAEKAVKEKQKSIEEAKILDREKEAREKKLRKELKLKDREYARLCEIEDKARSIWIRHFDSKEVIERFNHAVAERKNYEDQLKWGGQCGV